MSKVPDLSVDLKPIDERAFERFDTLPNSANVRVSVVAALHGVSTVTVWRWTKECRLPAPTKKGGVTAWNVGALRRSMSINGEAASVVAA